jgi:hypothetical protein
VRAHDRRLATVAAPAPKEATSVPDQIIDAVMARSVQANATKAKVLFGWIIQHDPPEHPAKYVARFATTHPTIYVMLADRLAELQAMLPPGLARSPRQPVDPPEIVECWFSKQARRRIW